MVAKDRWGIAGFGGIRVSAKLSVSVLAIPVIL